MSNYNGNWFYRNRQRRIARARVQRWKELELMGYGGHGKQVRAERHSNLREHESNYEQADGTRTHTLVELVLPGALSVLLVYILTAGSPIVTNKWSVLTLVLLLPLLFGGVAWLVFTYRNTTTSKFGYIGAAVGLLVLAAGIVGIAGQDTLGSKVVLSASTVSLQKQALDDAAADLEILTGNQELLLLSSAQIGSLGDYTYVKNLYEARSRQSQAISDKWNTNQNARVPTEAYSSMYTTLSYVGSQQARSLILYYNNYVTPEPALQAEATAYVDELNKLLGNGPESIRYILDVLYRALLK